MTEPEQIVPLEPVRPGSSSPQPGEPARPVEAAQARSKRQASPFVRVGIVTGTAALVLVGAMAAMGASPSPSGSTTTPTTPSATTDPNAGGPRPDRVGDIRGFGRGFGEITITSIDGSNLALETDDGWTRTIAVASTTEITKAGATIAVGDLAVGDEIHFAQTQATDGSYSITKIVVVMPSLSGEVTAKTADTITVTRRDGTTGTIHVDSATTYTVHGVENATLADISVGMQVRAQGTENSDGSLDASTVSSGFGGRGGHGGHGPRGDKDGSDDTKPDASPGASATP